MSEQAMDFERPGHDGERTTGDANAGVDMGHIHLGTTEANIYILGTDRPKPVFMACFSWYEGEDIEKRWDLFAQEMWKAGLEPSEDEPSFSFTEGEVTYDHYYLVSVYDDEEDDE